MTEVPQSVTPSAEGNGRFTQADIEAAEQDVAALQLEAFRETLPPHLDVDDQGNVVPAEGYVPCPLCKGDTVIPMIAPQSPHTISCPSCQGFGQVSTGSRLSETMNVSCDDCQGNGYVRRVDWAASHPEWQDPEVDGGA